MLEDYSKEEDSEITSSSIKRTKKYDSRKNILFIPCIDKINANKDINLENNNYNDNKNSNNNKDGRDSFYDSESIISISSSISYNKSINNNNFRNKSTDIPKNVLKKYIKKLTSKFENKKVSFNIEDNNNISKKNSYRKNSILSIDILRNNSNQINNNSKIVEKTTFSNNNKNRIGNLKNYQPNNDNYQDSQAKGIKRNNYVKEKTNNLIKSIKEKISIMTKEMLNRVKIKKIEGEKERLMKRNIKYKTLLSTITSPLIYSNKIHDEEFMDIINDDFSLSDKRKSFTKDNLDLSLLSKRKVQYNNIESISPEDNFYLSSSSSKIPQKNKKEKIIEKNKNMRRYQISSSFAERQMKRLQIKNNNINRLRKKLERKNNINFSPNIDSFSQKIIEQKGTYIPIYKRETNIQYGKNLKFNLFLKMKKENELKNENNKANNGFLSCRINEKNYNFKIIDFFETQMSWKEKVNFKTNNLRNSLEKEKENSLNKELTFKPNILGGSKDKKKNKRNSIFMKLYHEQRVKEKNLERLRNRLTPSFRPNINGGKGLNYCAKENINIFDNSSKLNSNNNNNKSILMNNISSNFEKLNKILYYEEEDSSATLSKRLKYCKKHEISKIKKDNINNVEKDDSITSLTRIDSDNSNNKYPNINENKSIFIDHEFYYPDSDRSIAYSQYNNKKSNYINNQNKSQILKNKIRYAKGSGYQSKIKETNKIQSKLLLSYFKVNNSYSKNKSIEIKSRKSINNNLEYKILKLGKLGDSFNSKIAIESKFELSKKEKINKKSIEKEKRSRYLDLKKFNKKQNETFRETNENVWKYNNSDYSKIMKGKKRK